MMKILNATAMAKVKEFLGQLYFELLKMFGRKRTHIGFGVFLLLELTFALLFMREESTPFLPHELHPIPLFTAFPPEANS